MQKAGRSLAGVLVVVAGALEVATAIAALFVVPGALVSFFDPTLPRQFVASLAELRGTAMTPGAIGLVPWIFTNSAIVVVLAFLLAHMLRKVMAAVGKGEPFAAANVGRIRALALWLALMQAAIMVQRLLVKAYAGEPAGWAAVDWSIMPWIGVLVVVVLAEVFAEGARLRDDAEMTV